MAKEEIVPGTMRFTGSAFRKLLLMYADILTAAFRRKHKKKIK